MIGAARWSCFIASAMFAASRLSSRPGFAGVENVQLYPRSETLQKYRLMSCPAEYPREPVRRQDNVTHAPGQARESPAVGDGGAAKRALVGRAGRGSLCARRGKGTACACKAGLVSQWPRRVVQRARTVLTVQYYQQRAGTPPVHGLLTCSLTRVGGTINVRTVPDPSSASCLHALGKPLGSRDHTPRRRGCGYALMEYSTHHYDRVQTGAPQRAANTNTCEAPAVFFATDSRHATFPYADQPCPCNHPYARVLYCRAAPRDWTG